MSQFLITPTHLVVGDRQDDLSSDKFDVQRSRFECVATLG